MSDIEVIATDGKIHKQIVWMSVNPEGIYYDVVLRRGCHMTLHKDGSMWATQNLKTLGITDITSSDNRDKIKKDRIAQYVPLSEVKRLYQLTTFNFIPDISKIELPNCKVKNLESVILIDTRRYHSKLYVTCNINIVEPKRFDHLQGMESTASEIIIYTQFSPWIVISIY